MHRTGIAVFAAGLMLVATAVLPRAAGRHETEYRGSVAAVEKAAFQIRTVDKEGKPTGKVVPFAVTETTKIQRGSSLVTFAEARLQVDERIIVIVAHADEAKVEWTCDRHPDVIRDTAGRCPHDNAALTERTRPARATEVRLAAR
jgi:hypothetical protein